MVIINSTTSINLFDGCYFWPLNFNMIYCFCKISKKIECFILINLVSQMVGVALN